MGQPREHFPAANEPIGQGNLRTSRPPACQQRAARPQPWRRQRQVIAAARPNDIVPVRRVVPQLRQSRQRRAIGRLHGVAIGEAGVQRRGEQPAGPSRRLAPSAEHRSHPSPIDQQLGHAPAETPIQDNQLDLARHQQARQVLGHDIRFVAVLVLQVQHVALAVADEVQNAERVRPGDLQRLTQPGGRRRHETHQRQRRCRRGPALRRRRDGTSQRAPLGHGVQRVERVVIPVQPSIGRRDQPEHRQIAPQLGKAGVAREIAAAGHREAAGQQIEICVSGCCCFIHAAQYSSNSPKAKRQPSAFRPRLPSTYAASAFDRAQSVAWIDPPSTGIIAPWTYPAAGEHRNTATLANSAGSPMRPSGDPAACRRIASSTLMLWA